MKISDTIFCEEVTGWQIPPSKPSSEAGWIKHVHCDGARFHVPTYVLYETWRGSRAVTWCSEPKCIMNKTAIDTLKEILKSEEIDLDKLN